MGERTRTTVIAVVTAVWAVNFAAGLFPPLSYKPDQAIHGIFMTIVGGLFAIGAVKKGDSAGGAHTATPAQPAEPVAPAVIPPPAATPAPAAVAPPPPAAPAPEVVPPAEVTPMVDPADPVGDAASP